MRLSLAKGKSFGIWQDNEFMLSPLLHSLSSNRGNSPLNSYLPEYLGGLDLNGFSQFSNFYPLYFIGSSLYETPQSSINNLNVLVHLHILIFSIGSYFLLRAIGCNRTPSIIGMIFIVYNVNTLNYATWINIIAPYSWLPWILTGLVMALEKNQYKYWAFFYFSSAMLFFASPAQPVIHAFFLVSALIINKYIITRKDKLKQATFKSTISKSVALLPLFIFTILPVLFPLILYTSRSIRWIGNFPPVLGFNKIPYEGFLTTQVEMSEIKNIVLPPENPREIGGLYFGIILICLIVYGVFNLRKNNLWKLFFSIALYSLLSSFGSNLGLATVNHAIPLLSAIREPSRFLIISHLCFGICAAISVNEINSRVTIRMSKIPMKSIPSGSINNFGTIFNLALLSTLLVFQPIAIKWTAPSINTSNYLSEHWIDFEAPVKVIKKLDPSSDYRVIFGGDIDTQKASMISAYYGIRTLNGYINPLPYKQFQAMYLYDGFETGYKELLGARYLVCTLNCSTVKNQTYSNYELIWSNKKFEIFENPEAIKFVSLSSISQLESQSQDLNQNFINSKTNKNIANLKQINNQVQRCEILNIEKKYFRTISARVYCSDNDSLIVSAFNDGNWFASINGESRQLKKNPIDIVEIELDKGLNYISVDHKSETRNKLLFTSLFSLLLYTLLFSFLYYRIKNRVVLNTKR